ncbi:hypothetical protein ACFQ46_12680 [Kineococcus sp. GCM10028916]|uniref:hypothetical protein n=1 Tax=Kineococcus sp. GCM10028916 TaxID=3273394 RepID=UPI0036448B68
MEPLDEQQRRIEHSPQQWASEVANAIPTLLPAWDSTLTAGTHQGVQLLGVHGTLEAGRPVLHVVYRHPWWTFTTGLRHWLDTRDHPRLGEDPDPAQQLAIALVHTDISEPLGTYADTLVPDADGTSWWGDEPLPGEHHRRGQRPSGDGAST